MCCRLREPRLHRPIEWHPVGLWKGGGGKVGRWGGRRDTKARAEVQPLSASQVPRTQQAHHSPTKAVSTRAAQGSAASVALVGGGRRAPEVVDQVGF